jgi:hypothetical protein
MIEQTHSDEQIIKKQDMTTISIRLNKLHHLLMEGDSGEASQHLSSFHALSSAAVIPAVLLATSAQGLLIMCSLARLALSSWWRGIGKRARCAVLTGSHGMTSPALER